MDKQHQRKLLDDSFDESYRTGKYSEEFKKLYEKMASLISELDFDDCIVNLSNSRQRVDFNLFYSNGGFVSVARPIELEEDVYYFSVSKNKEMLVIDQMEPHDLISRLKDVEYLLKKFQPRQPYMVPLEEKHKGKFRTWVDEHFVDIGFVIFVVLIICIGISPIVSNELYHRPVYELEINGQHRCIGTHSTVDLLKNNPNASIVRCNDGSYYPNATNVRYIRLIKPGYYFFED